MQGAGDLSAGANGAVEENAAEGQVGTAGEGAAKGQAGAVEEAAAEGQAGSAEENAAEGQAGAVEENAAEEQAGTAEENAAEGQAGSAEEDAAEKQAETTEEAAAEGQVETTEESASEAQKETAEVPAENGEKEPEEAPAVRAGDLADALEEDTTGNEQISEEETIQKQETGAEEQGIVDPEKTAEEPALKTQAQASPVYTVTFKDGVTGKVLSAVKVEKGKGAAAPKAPVHNGYAFSKWDKGYANVTGNLTVTATYTYKNGFYTENQKKVYYRNGKKVVGQLKVGNDWYYFNDQGIMQTGIVSIPAKHNKEGKKTCFYDANGKMRYGQRKIGAYWYMFRNGSGAMVVNAIFAHDQKTNPNGGPKKCYYDTNGRMVYKQRKIGNYWYMFREGSGAMVTDAIFSHTAKTNPSGGAKKTYYDANGRMIYGQRKVKGYWYMFRNGSGAMATGFYTHDNATNPNGGKKTCYYSKSGKMIYGMQNIGNKIYLFNKGSGALLGEIGSRTTWIGDSYSAWEGKADVLEQFPGVSLHAQGGKSFGCDFAGNPCGLNILKKLTSRGQVRECLVFALSTNKQGLTKENVNKVISLAGKDRTVIFVTAHNKEAVTGKRNYTAENNLLRNAAKQNSNVHVADWASYSANKVNTYFARDAVHPTSGNGYHDWVALIKDTIRKAAGNEAAK